MEAVRLLRSYHLSTAPNRAVSWTGRKSHEKKVEVFKIAAE
jgi:hypothetical protein